MKTFTLSTTRTFEDVWQETEICPAFLGTSPRPVKEVGYSRADHDGYRWYHSYFPVHPEYMTDAIKEEFERLVADILETEPVSQGIPGILEFCADYPESVQKDGARNRYNFYLEGKEANYWVTFLDLPKDYNFYLHIYIK